MWPKIGRAVTPPGGGAIPKGSSPSASHPMGDRRADLMNTPSIVPTPYSQTPPMVTFILPTPFPF